MDPADDDRADPAPPAGDPDRRAVDWWPDDATWDFTVHTGDGTDF